MVDKDTNKMREISVEKVTVNIGCGGDAKEIERAQKLLGALASGKKSVVTLSRRRSTFGVAKGRPVGVKVTLRGKDAIDFAKQALSGIENQLKISQFDDDGNFSFGVKEYIEMTGIKYDHDIGMLGFDVSVTLRRAGFSVSRRKIQTRKIPKRHKITKEESVEWAKRVLDVKIV